MSVFLGDFLSKLNLEYYPSQQHTFWQNFFWCSTPIERNSCQNLLPSFERILSTPVHLYAAFISFWYHHQIRASLLLWCFLYLQVFCTFSWSSSHQRNHCASSRQPYLECCLSPNFTIYFGDSYKCYAIRVIWGLNAYDKMPLPKTLMQIMLTHTPKSQIRNSVAFHTWGSCLWHSGRIPIWEAAGLTQRSCKWFLRMSYLYHVFLSSI